MQFGGVGGAGTRLGTEGPGSTISFRTSSVIVIGGGVAVPVRVRRWPTVIGRHSECLGIPIDVVNPILVIFRDPRSIGIGDESRNEVANARSHFGTRTCSNPRNCKDSLRKRFNKHSKHSENGDHTDKQQKHTETAPEKPNGVRDSNCARSPDFWSSGLDSGRSRQHRTVLFCVPRDLRETRCRCCVAPVQPRLGPGSTVSASD